jgi:hypothetical protein
MPVSIGEGVVGLVNRLGHWRDAEWFKNLVTYEGIDLLGKMLGGNSLRINMAYMEFNNGAPLAITPDPADGRTYYAALEGDGDTNHGYLRIPLLGDPVLSSSDETKFTTNRVTFYAMTQGSTGIRGANEFSHVVDSYVIGLALVAAADINDPAQDLVFSRTYDFTPKVKLANEEVSMRYRHTFPEEISSSSL